ncbi:MAG: hypothetical protein LQ340_004889 [Diploschistes diacapsis]|nr:MAG: hypothetical protein LQ340_004889 [Diploschistes diacapsis]
MIWSASLSRSAGLGLRRQSRAKPSNCRGLAAAASGSFSYETGDASGVKYASRNLPGPTTTVAVVAKAGTRFQPLPGYSEGLEKFAFKSTERRSQLRICRESELLGGQLFSYHTRENVVIGAKFLSDDLPYFTELLAEVVSRTKFTRYELNEEVLPNLKLAQKALLGRTTELAISSAHGVAFHRGLGEPLHPTSSTPLTKYLNASWLKQFASAAYAKNNFAVVANGAEASVFSKWMKEFFSDIQDQTIEGTPEIKTVQSKYYGGEERIAHDSGNTMILGFPGSSSFTGGFWKPEIAVLASLLGGETSIKWSPGFSLLSKATEAFPRAHISTTNAIYSDAGLLYVALTGNANDVRSAAVEAVKKIKSVAAGEISNEDFKKAIAAAKFGALDAGQNLNVGLEATGAGLVHDGQPLQIDEVGKSIERVSESQLKKIAKTLVEDIMINPRPDQRHICAKLRQSNLNSYNQHHVLTATIMAFAWKAAGLTYNRYLAVAARVVRRSLKEEKRLQAEKRGEMDLRFAKWNVSGAYGRKLKSYVLTELII